MKYRYFRIRQCLLKNCPHAVQQPQNLQPVNIVMIAFLFTHHQTPHHTIQPMDAVTLTVSLNHGFNGMKSTC